MRAILDGQFYVQRKDLLFILSVEKHIPVTFSLRNYDQFYQNEYYVPIHDNEFKEFIEQLNYIIDKDEYRFKSIDDLEIEIKDMEELLYHYEDQLNEKDDLELANTMKKLIYKLGDVESCLTEKYDGEYTAIYNDALNFGINKNEKILLFLKKGEFDFSKKK